jgi:hypothetical protein
MEFLLWRLDRILCKGCIPVSSSGRGTILPPQVEASRLMADIKLFSYPTRVDTVLDGVAMPISMLRCPGVRGPLNQQA